MIVNVKSAVYNGFMQDDSQLSSQDKDLIELASQQAEKCFNSDRTSIAAVLRTKSGQIYTGINIKYHARQVGMCAERVAIAKALEAGDNDFDAIVAVKYFAEDGHCEVVNSCGECRQAMCYHAPVKIIVANEHQLEIRSAAELLPLAYV